MHSHKPLPQSASHCAHCSPRCTLPSWQRFTLCSWEGEDTTKYPHLPGLPGVQPPAGQQCAHRVAVTSQPAVLWDQGEARAQAPCSLGQGCSPSCPALLAVREQHGVMHTPGKRHWVGCSPSPPWLRTGGSSLHSPISQSQMTTYSRITNKPDDPKTQFPAQCDLETYSHSSIPSHLSSGAPYRGLW